MLSISKILALAAILGAIWFAFRLIGRLDAARKQKVDRRDRGPVGGGPADPAPATREPAEGVLDLVKDERGNYVAKDKRDDRV